jgi:regulator of replication initiation timing
LKEVLNAKANQKELVNHYLTNSYGTNNDSNVKYMLGRLSGYDSRIDSNTSNLGKIVNPTDLVSIADGKTMYDSLDERIKNIDNDFVKKGVKINASDIKVNGTNLDTVLNKKANRFKKHTRFSGVSTDMDLQHVFKILNDTKATNSDLNKIANEEQREQKSEGTTLYGLLNKSIKDIGDVSGLQQVSDNKQKISTINETVVKKGDKINASDIKVNGTNLDNVLNKKANKFSKKNKYGFVNDIDLRQVYDMLDKKANKMPYYWGEMDLQGVYTKLNDTKATKEELNKIATEKQRSDLKNNNLYDKVIGLESSKARTGHEHGSVNNTPPLICNDINIQNEIKKIYTNLSSIYNNGSNKCRINYKAGGSRRGGNSRSKDVEFEYKNEKWMMIK